MERERREFAVKQLNCALELQRQIVGVKFLFSDAEFQEARARHIPHPMNYCVMVKVAMGGAALKATGADLACLAGGRALGLVEMDELHRSGRIGRNLGLYANLSTAKNVRDRMSYCTHKTHGVMVKPLADYDNEVPDVVLIVSSAYNVMRIVQGHAYYYGLRPASQLAGNQAICSESTALPYMADDINVSLLCIGTRHKAGWTDNELAVGIAFSRFQTVVQGVMETINIMDANEKKAVIERKLKDAGISYPQIQYDCNYYMKNR